jgi:hypothetical protein
MVRPFFVTTVLFAGAALAQVENGGVWTGYVGGWKPTGSDTVARLPGFPSFPRQQRPHLVVVPYLVNSGLGARSEEERRSAAFAEQAELRRAWEAEQARQQLQAQVENERRLAAEREALFQRQLEAERKLSAEREALAQERLKLERESVIRASAPLPQPVEPPRTPTPQKPGNDIYRWTDDDGVVHYSTAVPDSARPLAKKVGGPRTH